MDRIRDEMAGAKNDYTGMLGEMMTEYLRMHPETEIDDERTLNGAYGALYSAARKKQKGGSYAMPPREVFDGLMAYFGIPHADADYRACMAAMIGQAAPDSEAAAIRPVAREAAGGLDDLMDLDALLGD